MGHLINSAAASPTIESDELHCLFKSAANDELEATGVSGYPDPALLLSRLLLHHTGTSPSTGREVMKPQPCTARRSMFALMSKRSEPNQASLIPISLLFYPPLHSLSVCLILTSRQSKTQNKP